jgi:hypothetical protein
MDSKNIHVYSHNTHIICVGCTASYHILCNHHVRWQRTGSFIPLPPLPSPSPCFHPKLYVIILWPKLLSGILLQPQSSFEGSDHFNPKLIFKTAMQKIKAKLRTYKKFQKNQTDKINHSRILRGSPVANQSGTNPFVFRPLSSWRFTLLCGLFWIPALLELIDIPISIPKPVFFTSFTIEFFQNEGLPIVW